jgi:hypothetical protein
MTINCFFNLLFQFIVVPLHRGGIRALWGPDGGAAEGVEEHPVLAGLGQAGRVREHFGRFGDQAMG